MSPLSILVADDTPETRDVIAYCLAKQGHDVAVAAGGNEAISLVQDRAFDLVITDILMPDADGMQVIAEVRKHAPDAAIIAMTGGGDYMSADFLLRVAGRLGASAQLAKPFSQAQLLGAIESIFTSAPALVGAA